MCCYQCQPNEYCQTTTWRLDFLLAPQTSRMCASRKGSVFAQSTQTRLPPTQTLCNGCRLRLMLPPNCRAKLCKRFLPSCWTCKNSLLSQNIIFQRAQDPPMGGNSEIFWFSPQERSSHAGGWPPHPPVPGWKPDYKQCARGWRGILHVQCLQQQQLCQCQLRGEGAEEPA